MNVGSISSANASAAPAGALHDTRALAAYALGEVADRLQAWIGAIGGRPSGGEAPRGGADAVAFAPDDLELARGGDVYGLKQLASDVGARNGASPIDHARLERALTEFTRAAVVQMAGLAGAADDGQVARIEAAMAEGSAAAGPGLDGVIGGIEAATAVLAAANG